MIIRRMCGVYFSNVNKFPKIEEPLPFFRNTGGTSYFHVGCMMSDKFEDDRPSVLVLLSFLISTVIYS